MSFFIRKHPRPKMETTTSQLHSRRRNVLEHSLHGITETLEHALFAEEISARAGLFQSLDARVKVISTLALLISVSFSRSLWVIASIYLLTLLFAWTSAIPADYLIKRVWLALPFFTGLIVVPALFITPGPVLFHLPLGLGHHGDRRKHGTIFVVARQHFSFIDTPIDLNYTVEYSSQRAQCFASTGCLDFDSGNDLSLYLFIASCCQ